MRRKTMLGGVMAVALAVVSWNYFGAYRPVAQRLAQDERNAKVTLWAYHQYAVNPGVLVVDLRGFTGEAAMLDVMRTVLQAAEAHKERKFDRVVLAYHGTSKFVLDGQYFQTLGQEYESQNPVYTLRTFPQNVYKLDGTAAYGTWTGGLLGVVNKQMEDLNQLSHDWYLDDAIREHASKT